MLAGSSALLVTVHGEGGHSSAPHLARDPIIVAARGAALYAELVLRRTAVNPFSPAKAPCEVLR